jgi:hypothetical protein
MNWLATKEVRPGEAWGRSAPVRSWDAGIPQPNTPGHRPTRFGLIIQIVKYESGIGIARANSSGRTHGRNT